MSHRYWYSSEKGSQSKLKNISLGKKTALQFSFLKNVDLLVFVGAIIWIW